MNQVSLKEDKRISLSSEFLMEEEKLKLLKDTICKGATNDEFDLFVYTCQRLGLDPFARQIFPVKRWDSSLKREVMSIQTAIDGYRLIADRTGRYAPGKDPEYAYDDKGNLTCAKAFVMKQTPDGRWHEVAASAHFSEYAALKKDGTPNHMWQNKPHVMLSKCAESLALRKAFPAELSGVYTKEEMDQADNITDVHKASYVLPTINQVQVEELEGLLNGHDDIRKKTFKFLEREGCKTLSDINEKDFQKIKRCIVFYIEEKKENVPEDMTEEEAKKELELFNTKEK